MDFGFWTAVVIIVAIGAVSEMYRARVKSSTKASEEAYKEVIERLTKVEERMANLETILFEKDKARRYEDLK